MHVILDGSAPVCWLSKSVFGLASASVVAVSWAFTSALTEVVHSAELSAVGAALPESEFPEFSSGQPTKGQNFIESAQSKVTKLLYCNSIKLESLCPILNSVLAQRKTRCAKPSQAQWCIRTEAEVWGSLEPRSSKIAWGPADTAHFNTPPNSMTHEHLKVQLYIWNGSTMIELKNLSF